jgi:hypothetical protein
MNMSKDPHGRTEKLFGDLLAETENLHVEALLKAIRWLCILTEENGNAIEQHSQEQSKSLSEITDKIDRIANRG